MNDEHIEELIRHERALELCRAPYLIGARELLKQAAQRPEWVVPDRVPARDLLLVTGAPGAQKSWIAYDLALAAAKAAAPLTAATWLGGAVVAPAPDRRSLCESLVLNFDNSTAECARRFLRLGLRESDPVLFHTVDVGDRLRLPEAATKLEAMVDHLRPRVVLIDSLRQAHTSDENSSQEMMAIMSQLKRLYACGAAVVVVHHSGKSPSEGSKSRGSQEIDASATAVIHVAGERNAPTASWVKHRSWPLTEPQETLHFRVDDVGESTVVRRVDPPQRKPKREAA